MQVKLLVGVPLKVLFLQYIALTHKLLTDKWLSMNSNMQVELLGGVPLNEHFVGIWEKRSY